VNTECVRVRVIYYTHLSISRLSPIRIDDKLGGRETLRNMFFLSSCQHEEGDIHRATRRSKSHHLDSIRAKGIEYFTVRDGNRGGMTSNKFASHGRFLSDGSPPAEFSTLPGSKERERDRTMSSFAKSHPAKLSVPLNDPHVTTAMDIAMLEAKRQLNGGPKRR